MSCVGVAPSEALSPNAPSMSCPSTRRFSIAMKLEPEISIVLQHGPGSASMIAACGTSDVIVIGIACVPFMFEIEKWV